MSPVTCFVLHSPRAHITAAQAESTPIKAPLEQFISRVYIYIYTPPTQTPTNAIIRSVEATASRMRRDVKYPGNIIWAVRDYVADCPDSAVLFSG